MDMEESMLLQFPFELLEHILKCGELSIRDVCNVGSTCVKLKTLVNDSNQLWKTKFSQRWPHLDRYYYNGGGGEREEPSVGVRWLDECKARMEIGRECDKAVQNLVENCYLEEELAHEDFEPFARLMAGGAQVPAEDPSSTGNKGHPLAAYFLIDQLMGTMHFGSRNANLTAKFYAEKVLRFVRQSVLEGEWCRLKESPADRRILERGAVIVAQWCQPTLEITYEQIGHELDRLADAVMKEIELASRGGHPVLRATPKERLDWARRNIDDNQWKPDENKEVIRAAADVLFKQMKFHGNQGFYYVPENSFINKVLELKRGIPITLSIVFEAVTRRLGVKCEAVSFPGHFLLRWRENYRLFEGVPCEYFYIDVFNEGRLYSKTNCPRFIEFPRTRCPMSDLFKFGPADVEEVVQRMAHNLEVANRQRTDMVSRNTRLKCVLELLHMLNPKNINCLIQLMRFYVFMNMNIDHSFRKFDRLVKDSEVDDRSRGQASHTMEEFQLHRRRLDAELSALASSPKVVKERKVAANKGVRFAVGMLARHRLYNYRCVIYSWDPFCAESAEWMQQMNVNGLERKGDQPYYGVLVSDGTQRYAAEENLELMLSDRTPIDHHLIGKYFDTFHGTHYMPNANKAAEYPDDARVRDQMVAAVLATCDAAMDDHPPPATAPSNPPPL